LQSQDNMIWGAVNVKRGLIEDVEAFANEEFALEPEQIWRKELNPDYDEVGGKNC